MAGERGNLLGWIRSVRVGHGTLAAILLALAALWLLFQYTDLWYVLFP
jgi:hypothetical protein